MGISLYDTKIDLGFVYDYTVGTTLAIERYDIEKIYNKILEYNKDNLVDEYVLKRVSELIEKREVIYEEFFLKTYLVRILDLLIVIDNDRKCVNEDEEFYPGDEEEYEISLCNIALVDLFKRSDRRREQIKEKVEKLMEE